MKGRLILFFLSCQILNASSTLDSLVSCLNEASDQHKIEIYQELAFHTKPDSLEQSIAFSKQALKYAIQIDDKSKTADILFDIACFYLDKKMYKKSNEYFSQSAKVYIKVNNLNNTALCFANIGSNYSLLYEFRNAINFYNKSIETCLEVENSIQIEAVCKESIGSIFYIIGNIQQSLQYHYEALNLYRELGDELGIGNIYYLLGADYSAECLYDKSIEFYFKALEIYEKESHMIGMAYVTHAIGLVYQDFNHLEKSIDYNNQALEYLKMSEDEQLSASIYKWLGSIYGKKRNWEKSFQYLEKALSLEINRQDQVGLITTFQKIGAVQYKRKLYDKALHYLQKSYDLIKNIDDRWRKAKLFIDMGKVYVEQNRYLHAIGFLKKGTKIAMELKIRDLVLDGYKNMSQCFAGMAEYKSALEYQILYTNLQDSIYYENSLKIADMQLRYETDKREQTNDILRKENNLQKEIIGRHETQRWLLFACITILSSLMVLGYAKLISKNKFGIKLYRKLSNAMAEHKAQEQSLIHLSALTKLGELAASIIHDLKQPLQDIKLSAEDIESGLSKMDKDSDLIKTLLNDIFEDVDRIAFLTDYVINSTNKKVYDKVSEFDVNKSIANAYRMIRKQLMRQDFNLCLNLKDNLPPVLGNPWRLEHVLLNILSNSSYALSENRKYQGSGFKDTFTIESYANENNVFIRIKDNGIGVISSFKSQMFIPFASSKKPGEGSGLGLSIVYNVIRDMNGRLDFNSKPFVGTVITLVFPSAANQRYNHSKERKFLEEVENFGSR